MRQGDCGYGDNMGFWFFNPEDFEALDGKRILKLSIAVRRKAGGRAEYVGVNIMPHNLTERTVYQPEFINGKCYYTLIDNLGCAIRDVIDEDLFTAIQDGMVLGFGVKELESQYNNYVILDSLLALRFIVED